MGGEGDDLGGLQLASNNTLLIVGGGNQLSLTPKYNERCADAWHPKPCFDIQGHLILEGGRINQQLFQSIVAQPVNWLGPGITTRQKPVVTLPCGWHVNVETRRAVVLAANETHGRATKCMLDVPLVLGLDTSLTIKSPTNASAEITFSEGPKLLNGSVINFTGVVAKLGDDSAVHFNNTTSRNASSCPAHQAAKASICDENQCAVCEISVAYDELDVQASCKPRRQYSNMPVNPCWLAPPPPPPPPPPPEFTDWSPTTMMCWLDKALNMRAVAEAAFAAQPPLDGAMAAEMTSGDLEGAWRQAFGATYTKEALIIERIEQAISSTPQLVACCDVPGIAYCSQWCNNTWGCGVGSDPGSDFVCDCSGCHGCK